MTAPGHIDVHAHHYPQAYVDACLDRLSPFSASRLATGRVVVREGTGIVLTIPTDLPEPGQRLDLMSRAGIELQLLSVPSPSVYAFEPAVAAALARRVNDELVSYAEQGEGRLRVLLTVPLPDGAAAVRELDAWSGHPLVAGVLICSHVGGEELDSVALADFWAYAEEHALLTLLHPTAPICDRGYEAHGLSIAAGFMHEQSRALARLSFSAVADPRTGGLGRLVVSHLGGGIASLIDRLDVYWDRFVRPDDPGSTAPSVILRRLHYDVSLNSRPAILGALDAFGTGRLVLGTDFPHMPYGMEGVVDQVISLRLGAAATDALLRDNARALLAAR